MNKAVQLVESATIIAGQMRTPMCYVCNKPRAKVEYPQGSLSRIAQDVRVYASIQSYYAEQRAKGSPCFCGD